MTRVVASLDDAVLQSSRDLGALDNKGMAELPPASFFDAIERQATEDGLERAEEGLLPPRQIQHRIGLPTARQREAQPGLPKTIRCHRRRQETRPGLVV